MRNKLDSIDSSTHENFADLPALRMWKESSLPVKEPSFAVLGSFVALHTPMVLLPLIVYWRKASSPAPEGHVKHASGL